MFLKYDVSSYSPIIIFLPNTCLSLRLIFYPQKTVDKPLNETDKISAGVVKSHLNFRVPHKVE